MIDKEPAPMIWQSERPPRSAGDDDELFRRGHYNVTDYKSERPPRSAGDDDYALLVFLTWQSTMLYQRDLPAVQGMTTLTIGNAITVQFIRETSPQCRG